MTKPVLPTCIRQEYLDALVSGKFGRIIAADGARIFTNKVLEQLVDNSGFPNRTVFLDKLHELTPAIKKIEPVVLSHRLLPDNIISIYSKRNVIGREDSEQLIKAMAQLLIHEGYGEKRQMLIDAFIETYTKRLKDQPSQAPRDDGKITTRAEIRAKELADKRKKFGKAACEITLE